MFGEALKTNEKERYDSKIEISDIVIRCRWRNGIKHFENCLIHLLPSQIVATTFPPPNSIASRSKFVCSKTKLARRLHTGNILHKNLGPPNKVTTMKLKTVLASLEGGPRAIIFRIYLGGGGNSFCCVGVLPKNGPAGNLVYVHIFREIVVWYFFWLLIVLDVVVW